MKHILYRENWTTSVDGRTLGGLYKIEAIHDGEEYEVFEQAPCENWVRIGQGPAQKTINPETGEERFVSAHILIFETVSNHHGGTKREQKNILSGEFVGVFDDIREARILQGRLARISEVMDS